MSVAASRQFPVTKVQGSADPLEMAIALLENGDALLSDAAYLMDDGRQSRAAALAVMASEEFSKVHYCLDAITGEAVMPSSSSRAWKDHREKLETAKALELAFVDAEPNFDMDVARADVDFLVQLKMACLYVDHESGAILRPRDKRVDVAALIVSGNAKSALLHRVIDRLTPEVLVAMDEHRDLLTNVLDHLVNEDDPEGTIKRLRTVAAAAALDDPDALYSALESALQAVAHEGRAEHHASDASKK